MWTVAQEHAERNIRKNKRHWLSRILTATAAPYIMVYEYDLLHVYILQVIVWWSPGWIMLMRTKVVVLDFLVNNWYLSLVFGDKNIRTCNASLTEGRKVTGCQLSAVGKPEWLVLLPLRSSALVPTEVKLMLFQSIALHIILLKPDSLNNKFETC